jgi:hypothetical protein
MVGAIIAFVIGGGIYLMLFLEVRRLERERRAHPLTKVRGFDW